MVETTERPSINRDAAGVRTASHPRRTPTRARPWLSLRSPPAERRSHMQTLHTPSVSRRTQVGHFLRHYFEMCVPMCVGFAVGDLLYFWAAGLFGYSEPFRQLPELSVLIVTLNMTVPMAAWMLFRRMSRRPTAEMAAAMPILAIALLALGWLAILPRSELALLEHGLMMPVMLIPMFFRLDVYTGRAGHTAQSPPARR